jgi:dihydroxyacetone kinase-like protein
VWWDVIAEAKTALDRGDNTPNAMKAMALAAASGAEKTIPMQAKKGRASYLGERSVGHQDPGATSTKLMIETLSNVINEA